MYSYKQAFLILFCLVLSTCFAMGQKTSSAYQKYIDKYSDIAIMHQKKYGIPASIKLAQAIMESGGGTSELAKKSNNHFGIKCHGWKGKSVTHDDDLRGECFRKYKTVEDSYDDHSRFLTERSYYKSLFQLKIDDYKGWAKGLQKCGYATDKTYPAKLIRIIEDYELYKYDSGKKSSKKIEASKKAVDQQAPNGKSFSLDKIERKVSNNYGLSCVYAMEKESLKQVAYILHVKEKDLRKYNEVPEDFIFRKGDIIYLEKKKKKASKPNYEHIIKAGESMHAVSQQYGIQLNSLYKINKKKPDYIPKEGDVLKLR